MINLLGFKKLPKGKGGKVVLLIVAFYCLIRGEQKNVSYFQKYIIFF